MSSNFKSDVPLANVPLVDPGTGLVSEAWFLFLIQLWRRTGGSAPANGLFTVADVLALEETFAPAAAGAYSGLNEATFAKPSPTSMLADVVVSPAQSNSKMADMVTAPLSSIGGPTTTSAPGAGGAGALPATPAGYAVAMIDGVKRLVAFY